MTETPADTSRRCTHCGDVLFSGPLGPQCPRCSLALTTSPEEDEEARVAELFPELRLEGCLGRGGFGAVFRAEHRRMRRPVALKFLDTLLARSPGAVALFEQEMVTVGALDHPAIVRAYDAGERDGHWFIIMELVDGLDCGALARKHGRLPLAEACEIIRQAALALDYAHGCALVHRDVKPGNLMVSCAASPLSTPNSPPGVKVLDFGLAGLAVAPVFGGPLRAVGDSDQFFGTLEYTAPEQIETPAGVDARADVFGLGATLWRLLTGRTPRKGDDGERSLFRQMQKLTAEPVPPLATERPDLPREFTQLCDRMLALDREDRPATAAEVASLLEPWCAGAELPRLFTEGPLAEKPLPAPRRAGRRVPRFALLAVVALGILIAVAFGVGRSPATGAKNSDAALARPVFSPRLTALRRLDAASGPRFLAGGWKLESETPVTHSVAGARMLAGGEVAYRTEEPNGYAALQVQTPGFDTGPRVLVPTPGAPRYFGVAPDSGFIIWDQRQDREYRHLGRARPDASKLESLTFDPAGDFDGTKREEMRRFRDRYVEEDQERRPAGFAFVTAGQIPENTGLQAGDALIADEGHRWLAPKDRHGRGALWRCRFDDNQPAQRLGEDAALIAFPLDVTVARSGVFLLNRQDIVPVKPVGEADRTRRVLRWDRAGFHACTLGEPVYDPSGLAADPLGSDLYVIEGAMIPSTNPGLQRLLRLHRTGPDQYDVEVVADRFGRLGLCGVSLTPDGQRLVLSDSGNRAIVVLKRERR